MEKFRKSLGKIKGLFILDWLLILIIFITASSLEFAPPFQRDVVFDPSINFPHREWNTVPSWTLPIIAIILPSFFISLFFLLGRFFTRPRSAPTYDGSFIFFSKEASFRVLHLCILGLLLGVAMTYLSINLVKIAAGRPRPDFIARCNPIDLNAVPIVCKTPETSKLLKDGRKSFPSGHAACNFLLKYFFILILFAFSFICRIDIFKFVLL